MRVSTSGITASLTLALLATSEAHEASTQRFAPTREPRPFQAREPTAFDNRPLELHPILSPPQIQKVTKPTKLKKYRRKSRRRRIHRAVWRIPLPPRIVRSGEPQSVSAPSPRAIISFDGPKLGLDIETSLESRIDPTPYGSLVPMLSAHPTKRPEILTLRSFAGIDKQIDSAVIGVEAGLGYRFTRSALSKGAVPTLGPSGLDASVTTRIGTVIDRRLLYVTGGIALANFAKGTYGRVHESLYGLVHESLYGGWTAGVGVEQHLTPTLLLRTEYFYQQFPAARFQSHNFRIGVGVKF